MSEIDWDKAPEGATHHVFTGGLDSHHCWYRVRDDGYDFQYSDEMRGWKKGKFQTPASEKLTERPSPAWSGEGLPPVGLRCEAAIPHTSGPDNERSFIWIEGSVIAYNEIKGKTYAWFAEDDGFYPPNVLEFRPIRTSEQIAADEREAAIEQMWKVFYDAPGLAKEGIEALYDAGFRKA